MEITNEDYEMDDRNVSEDEEEEEEETQILETSLKMMVPRVPRGPMFQVTPRDKVKVPNLRVKVPGTVYRASRIKTLSSHKMILQPIIQIASESGKMARMS
ncbi:hypothetical protein TWF281_007832 [Arthrobotrys megalospora]